MVSCLEEFAWNKSHMEKSGSIPGTRRKYQLFRQLECWLFQGSSFQVDGQINGNVFDFQVVTNKMFNPSKPYESSQL